MARPGTLHVLACIFLLLLLHICHTAPVDDGPLSETDNFPYHAQLDENYSLQWVFNSTHIMFHTRVKAKGYVGFGLSRNGNMAPGDMVIAWMDANETVHFHDRHATSRTMPVIDEQQDWELLDFKIEDGQNATMTVMRKLNTCDHEGDIPIEDSTTRVIYAYSDTVPDSDDVIPYHGSSNRGTKSLLLLNVPSVEGDAGKMPDDVITVDFLKDNYAVPDKDTTYACILVKLPDLQEKHHLIRIEPVVQAGHEKLVHHFVLYKCKNILPHEMLNSPFVCYESPIWRALGGDCDYTTFAWGIGGSAFDFPPHVGLSLGAPGDPVYFRLETHYDNPDKRSDFVDSSGFRMYLTKQLRQHDAGMLEVGAQINPSSHIIPPGMPDFLTRGQCPSSCLNKVVGDGDIRIFADFLHSHLLGRRLSTRHIRNGVELPPIARDDHYDFDYQEMRTLSEERIIMKGDTLITDCHYDSSQRTSVTYGGLGTRQEMCLSFLLYYPRTELTDCFTILDYSKNGEEMYPEGVRTFVRNANWSDPDTRDAFVHNAETSDVHDQCVFMQSETENVPALQPMEFTEYETEDVCNPSGNGSGKQVTLTLTPSLLLASIAACIVWLPTRMT